MLLSTPLPPKHSHEDAFRGSLHFPLKRGMPDDTLTGVEVPKAARCALEYINPFFVNSHIVIQNTD